MICPWLDGDRVASVGMMDADGAAQVRMRDAAAICMRMSGAPAPIVFEY